MSHISRTGQLHSSIDGHEVFSLCHSQSTNFVSLCLCIFTDHVLYLTQIGTEISIQF